MDTADTAESQLFHNEILIRKGTRTKQRLRDRKEACNCITVTFCKTTRISVQVLELKLPQIIYQEQLHEFYTDTLQHDSPQGYVTRLHDNVLVFYA